VRTIIIDNKTRSSLEATMPTVNKYARVLAYLVMHYTSGHFSEKALVLVTAFNRILGKILHFGQYMQEQKNNCLIELTIN